ncbi:hypothetical protein LCGC14_0694140 [marine sediment metagenome]|uniref:Uncharacterized protein n=1 Tax=marine sediment metagenome TaxID=412755 RepID=A0A0F9R4W6_9ZZZZ
MKLNKKRLRKDFFELLKIFFYLSIAALLIFVMVVFPIMFSVVIGIALFVIIISFIVWFFKKRYIITEA